MNIPPPDQITTINEAIRHLTVPEKRAFLKSAFRDFRPQCGIRDFVVMKNTVDAIKAETIIFHLPTMLWQGFHLSFADACQRLKEHPEDDRELIYEIVATGHQPSKE